MSGDQKCGACGAPFVYERDEDTGIPWPELVRDCECLACPICGLEFRLGDDLGPTIAADDETARKYDASDSGRCDSCWAKVGGRCSE